MVSFEALRSYLYAFLSSRLVADAGGVDGSLWRWRKCGQSCAGDGNRLLSGRSKACRNANS